MNTDWQRQAWLSLPLRSIDFVRKTVWNMLPAFAGGAFFFKDLTTESKWALLTGICVAYIFYAILQYVFFQFRIESDRIVVRSGVFVRQNKSILYEKIQAVQTSQNVVNKVFKLISIGIETAGSTKEEVRLFAVPQAIGEHLETQVKLHRNPLVKTEEGDTEPSTHSPEEVEMLLHLNHSDLTKTAISGNPFVWWASITALLAFLGQTDNGIKWIFDKVIGNIFGDLSFMSTVRDSSLGFWAFIASGLFFAFALSLLGAVLWHWVYYYNYQLTQSGKELKNKAGLLTQHSTQMQSDKIQKMSLHSHPLRRRLGFYQIHLHQASSLEQEKNKFVIPFWPENRLPELVKRTLDLEFMPYFKQSDPYYLKHMRKWNVWLPLIPIALATYFHSQWWGLALIYTLSQWFFTKKAYQAKRYALNDNLLCIQSGWLAQKTNLVQPHQVQQINLKQSPFQRRHGVASLRFWTAAGQLYIPYIQKTEAFMLMNQILKTVETSDKTWL